MTHNSEITYTTTINRLEHLGGHYLEVSPLVQAQLNAKPGSRLLCTLNQVLTFPCGLVSLGNGSSYILLNAKRMKEAKAKAGDKVTVRLQPDVRPYGMEMPEELAVLLDQDLTGQERFNQLTPGKQRTLIHYVSAVKSSQLRIERAIRYLENLKQQPLGKESISKIIG